MTLGVIWWGLFTAAVTLLTPKLAGLLTILIVLRLLLGMGEAVMYPATNCVVAGIARDRPRDHPWVSKAEKEFIESGLPQSGASKASAGALTLFMRPDLQAITFSYFCYGYAAYIFFTWFFIYLSKVRALNLKQSTYCSMLPFIAMAVGSALGGWISDRVSRRLGTRAGRCIFASIAMLLAAAFVGLSTVVASAQSASLFLAGGAGALYLAQSSFWSLSADIGKSAAGSVSGLMNMGGQLGGAQTASLTPLIAERLGWTASFLVAAALCGVGGLAWLLVESEPIRTTAQPAA